jgi:hypothetical protein
MTFAPNLFTNTGSAADFSALRATRANQTGQLARDAEASATISAFRKDMRFATLPELLIGSPKLLDFVATAFGIEDLKGDRRTLIGALNEGASTPRALSRFQSDPRVREFAAFFGYDAGGPPLADPVAREAFTQQIVDRWLAATFETRVERASDPMGKALRFDRLAAEASAALEAEGVRSGRALVERLMADPDALEVLKDIAGPIPGFDGMRKPEQVLRLTEAFRKAIGFDAALLGGPVMRGRAVGAYLAVAVPREAALNRPETGATIPAYTPVLPSGGYVGWRFLKGSLEQQQALFDRTAAIRRDVEHFRQNVGAADTAEKLAGDRRLLRVAVGAYGLADELDKRAFIERALREGTTDRTDAANRISDPRYRAMAAGFGYGDPKGAQVGERKFVEQVVADYRRRAFEAAVGEVDGDMRLALNFDREAQAIATSGARPETMMLRLLGDTPMRRVLEGALGLPSDFVKLDLDRQTAEVESRFRRVFGAEVGELKNEETREAVIRRFFTQSALAAGPSALTPGATALTLLQSNGLGAQGAANLFQSALL